MLLGKMSDSYIHGSMPNMRIDISMAPHILGWEASYPLSQKGAVIGNINRSLHLAWVPIQAILVQHFFHLQYAQHHSTKQSLIKDNAPTSTGWTCDPRVHCSCGRGKLPNPFKGLLSGKVRWMHSSPHLSWFRKVVNMLILSSGRPVFRDRGSRKTRKRSLTNWKDQGENRAWRGWLEDC